MKKKLTLLSFVLILGLFAYWGTQKQLFAGAGKDQGLTQEQTQLPPDIQNGAIIFQTFR